MSKNIPRIHAKLVDAIYSWVVLNKKPKRGLQDAYANPPGHAFTAVSGGRSNNIPQMQHANYILHYGGGSAWFSDLELAYRLLGFYSEELLSEYDTWTFLAQWIALQHYPHNHQLKKMLRQRIALWAVTAIHHSKSYRVRKRDVGAWSAVANQDWHSYYAAFRGREVQYQGPISRTCGLRKLPWSWDVSVLDWICAVGLRMDPYVGKPFRRSKEFQIAEALGPESLFDELFSGDEWWALKEALVLREPGQLVLDMLTAIPYPNVDLTIRRYDSEVIATYMRRSKGGNTAATIGFVASGSGLLKDALVVWPYDRDRVRNKSVMQLSTVVDKTSAGLETVVCLDEHERVVAAMDLPEGDYTPIYLGEPE